MIKKYPWAWQSHLERISDYICVQYVRWYETDKGITFRDDSRPTDSLLQLRHFRSSSIKSETKNLSKCWKKCIINKQIISAEKIKTEDE